MGETHVTERLSADNAGLTRAAELLRAGETVAFPTETVYGLGADATDGSAVARIFEAKGRPRFNPLIVHVASTDAVTRLIDLPDAGLQLAEAFWPGPLTLVASMRPDAMIADLVTAGLPTLAVRVPANPLARSLIKESGLPLAAPSANLSGSVSPTNAAHVLEGLGGRVSAVLDGGRCPVGVESTIVGFSNAGASLLRPGGVPAEDIRAMVGILIEDPGTGITAPGQMESHYAPSSQLRLNARDSLVEELILGFGPMTCDLNLSASADLREAAANLFAHLRALDAMARGRPIAVAPVPEVGLGVAINDRLRRAAAPRV
ncbi:MAG: L-threonylcarbamoyladenylate synthase [Paracoccaceae bacterium]